MIPDRDTQIPTVLEDADLDAVSGGSGYVADAAARAALGFLYNRALTEYMSGEITRNSGPCP